MTSPSGLERPVIPLALTEGARSSATRHQHSAVTAFDLDVDRPVHVGHIAFWMLAGSVGWATLIGVGWFAVDMVGRLLP
jgi:hypothetical protein